MAEEAAGASTPSVESQESVQNSETQTQQAPVDDQPWRKVKHKLKVDGAESEVDYDELVRRAQKAAAADKRLAEAANYKKKLDEHWNSADPTNFFKAKNLDPEKWAEDLLLAKLRRDAMTPEERYEAEQKAKERADMTAKERELEELRAEKQQALVEKINHQLDVDITEAFKAQGLTPSPAVVKRMAELMEAHMDHHDGEMLPAAKALEMALGHRKTDLEGYLSTLSAKQLRDVLPKKLLDELRRDDVELVRSQSPLGRQSTNGARPSTPMAKPKKASTEEFFKNMEAKFSS